MPFARSTAIPAVDAHVGEHAEFRPASPSPSDATASLQAESHGGLGSCSDKYEIRVCTQIAETMMQEISEETFANLGIGGAHPAEEESKMKSLAEADTSHSSGAEAANSCGFSDCPTRSPSVASSVYSMVAVGDRRPSCGGLRRIEEQEAQVLHEISKELLVDIAGGLPQLSDGSRPTTGTSCASLADKVPVKQLAETATTACSWHLGQASPKCEEAYVPSSQCSVASLQWSDQAVLREASPPSLGMSENLTRHLLDACVTTTAG